MVDAYRVCVSRWPCGNARKFYLELARPAIHRAVSAWLYRRVRPASGVRSNDVYCSLLRAPTFSLVGAGHFLDVRWSYIAAVVIFLAVLLRGTQKHTTPFAKYGFVWVFGVFYLWILIQSAWALNQPEHQRLVEYFVKYIVIVYLAYRCMDTVGNMKLVMLAHIIGCFYFGWIAYTEYEGGRFEDFGGPGLGEANTAALTLATGCLLAGSLFLTASWAQRAVLSGDGSLHCQRTSCNYESKRLSSRDCRCHCVQLADAERLEGKSEHSDCSGWRHVSAVDYR